MDEMEMRTVAKEFHREVERKTGWKVDGVVSPSFSYGGKTRLVAEVKGWYLGTSEDEHVRRVSPEAEKALEAYKKVEADFNRRYPGVEFGIAGGIVGTRIAGRTNMKKGCATCGCGILADSLIGPMSADEKDAEAGPKEGPPAMVQPLRARRDYGAVAARVAVGIAQQYESLNDAAEVTGERGYERQGGSTDIWYMKPAFAREGFMGFDFLKEKDALPDPKELSATHVHLGKIRESDLERVFGMMQGESWSPMGQANSLIRGLGLHHTSMSTGDVVEVRGRAYLVDRMGFEELPLVKRV